jgi:hypothetical protein
LIQINKNILCFPQLYVWTASKDKLDINLMKSH